MSKISIYIDGPSEAEMKDLFDQDISGFTFNPTLFKSLHIKDYLGHSQKIQKLSNGLPISLEVIGDTYEEMVFQGKKLASLGSNVFVKIPITYTSGESTLDVIKALSIEGINLNITAIFTFAQIKEILPTIKNTNAIISVFAGRLYDIGIDAKVKMQEMSFYIHEHSQCNLLWASPRMHYDAITAKASNCDIITMTNSMYKKMSLIGKTPEEYSLDTVKMFFNDAQASGYSM
jgi:transaldolase